MSEKMREEFHEWCDTNGFASDRYELSDLGEAYKHLCGEYVIRESRLMWQSWQASRAALVVELPDNCKGMALTVDELRVMLDNIGVTMK